jgi:hypothetical protein
MMRTGHHCSKKKIRTTFIYTAGATDEMIQEIGFDRNVKGTVMTMARIFGSCESFFVADTLQFDDYSRYVAPRFDPEAKKELQKEAVPAGLQEGVRPRNTAGPADEVIIA